MASKKAAAKKAAGKKAATQRRNGPKARRSLTPQLRSRIVTAGRRQNRGSAKEVAEQLTGGDVAIVRRVWQAAGVIDVAAPTRERAEKLVATWLERGRS